MSEEAPTEPPCGEHGRRDPWDPARRWWQPGRPFNRDAGRPPLLDPQWADADRLQNRSWPLFVPFISGPVQRPSQISKEQHAWRVDLDVAHFSPSEISVSVRRGFLEVEGKHAERPDEHGFTARWFTRKYRLPSEVDVTKMASTLSVDGILTVEGPVPETCVPAAAVIPMKVETEACEEQEDKHEELPETNRDSSGASKAQRIVGRPQPEDYGTDSQLEAPPGSSTAELQPHEEEETHQKPAGESHPSPSAEPCQDATQSQEPPDAATSREPEHEAPAADGEIQVSARLSLREEPEPEAPDTKPEEAE